MKTQKTKTPTLGWTRIPELHEGHGYFWYRNKILGSAPTLCQICDAEDDSRKEYRDLRFFHGGGVGLGQIYLVARRGGVFPLCAAAGKGKESGPALHETEGFTTRKEITMKIYYEKDIWTHE